MVKKIVILLLCVALVGVAGCEQSDKVLIDSVDISVFSVEKHAESVLKQAMDDFGVELTAEDTQYDMPNNLDKGFYLSGYAYLSDYYNYGFDNDIEKDYFVLKVDPITSDTWYIYCHRTSFDDVFKGAKEGRIYISASCKIPENPLS